MYLDHQFINKRNSFKVTRAALLCQGQESQARCLLFCTELRVADCGVRYILSPMLAYLSFCNI